jgi:DNA repair protein RadD
LKLRPVQEEPVAIGVEFFNIKGIDPSIIVAPTAFGKSIVIAHIAKGIGEKVLVLQPSKELLEQNFNKFTMLGGVGTIYSASLNTKEVSDVTYATLGSIIKETQNLRKMGITKVIIDECDRYPRKSEGLLRRFITGLRATHVLGLTATPLKLQTNMGEDGPYSKLVMLTNWSKHGTFFKHILHVAQIQEMVELGYWSPLIYQSYDFDTGKLVYNSTRADWTSKSMEQAYEHQNIEKKIIDKIAEVKDRKSILVAVPSIAQAKSIAGRVPNAAVVHGGTKKKERDRIVDEFKAGKIRVVVQVDVLTVGFDYPQLDCIITGRPTSSISWWYQFVGRGTRIDPYGLKKDCLVVDFVGSVQRFGKVEELYYAEHNGEWELYGEGKKQLTGLPMHQIGLHLEGGINVGKNVNEAGEEKKVVYNFGKYKDMEVRLSPPLYRQWLLENMEWGFWNIHIKEEIERLQKYQKI